MIDFTRERPLTLKRAAAFMDVSTRTIERWFKLGLEQTKAGGKVYTSRSALQRFAMRNAVPDDSRGHGQEVLSPEDRNAIAYLESIGIS